MPGPPSPPGRLPPPLARTAPDLDRLPVLRVEQAAQLGKGFGVLAALGRDPLMLEGLEPLGINLGLMHRVAINRLPLAHLHASNSERAGAAVAGRKAWTATSRTRAAA